MPKSIPADMEEAARDFERKADKIIEDFCVWLEAQVLPKAIYHYTDELGLRGILESGQLRFTNIFDLNDPSELRHSCSQAIESLRRRAEPISQQRPEVGFFAEQFAGLLHSGQIERVSHQFVCSFSARGDDLGQWRAYADNGRGYALMFDTEPLDSAFTKKDGKPLENHATFSVQYDQQRLAKLQDEIAEGVFDLVSMPRDRGLSADVIAEYLKDIELTLWLHTLQTSIFFKHWGYDNEREYRFLQHFSAAGGLPPETKRRFRPHQLVRYREFNWRAAAPKALTGIIVGPAADKQKAFKYVADCLQDFGYEPVTIMSSEIPYRAL